MIISQSNHFESSTLNSSSYDFNKRELFITFKSSITYLYKNVNPKIYEEFIGSESHGSSFNRLIKSDKNIECIKIA